MARIARVSSLLKTLALVSWRDARSLGSIAGQNIFIFIVFVALQPESAAFFLLLLAVVLLFPLSANPMERIPPERRALWPLFSWEWTLLRLASLLLNPLALVGLLLLVKAGWRIGAVVIAVGLGLSLLKYFAQNWAASLRAKWQYRMPAPPGVIGGIMRLQWRSMWRTLDPYFALVLLICTEIYKFSGRPLDPAAQRIIALVVALAVSTESQVLFGIDGRGAERYRQLPMRGWQILLAKDLAFLLLVALLVWPLDLFSGVLGAMAAAAVGHHQSVWKPVVQERWRFTSGALLPHGALQTVALFAVGNVVQTQGPAFTLFCVAAWAGSLTAYGWVWDKRARRAQS